MKKFILLLTGIYQKFGIVLLVATVFSSPIRGTGIEFGAAGAVLGSILAPMLAPMVKEIREDVQTRIDGIMRDLKNMNGCNTICNTKRACKTKRIASICKGRCQKRIKVGPYTLKIRFRNADKDGSSWTLQQCVESAPDNPGKAKNPKEIAIYGEEDFNFAIDMIAEMAALDKFILLKGRLPKSKEKEEKKEEEESKKRNKKGSSKSAVKMAPPEKTHEQLIELVKEAKEDRKDLEEAFEEHVQSYFGPQ